LAAHSLPSVLSVNEDIGSIRIGVKSTLTAAAVFIAPVFYSMSASGQTLETSASPELGYITLKLGNIVSYEQCQIALSHFRWYCDYLQNDEDMLKTLAHPYFDSKNISIAWFDFDQDGDLDLLVTGNYSCGGHNCPYKVLVDSRTLSTPKRIAPVASALPFDPSVVFSEDGGRIGLRFSEATYVFWFDDLKQVGVNE
jgi:hypothetical protein